MRLHPNPRPQNPSRPPKRSWIKRKGLFSRIRYGKSRNWASMRRPKFPWKPNCRRKRPTRQKSYSNCSRRYPANPNASLSGRPDSRRQGERQYIPFYIPQYKDENDDVLSLSRLVSARSGNPTQRVFISNGFVGEYWKILGRIRLRKMKKKIARMKNAPWFSGSILRGDMRDYSAT